MTTQLIRSTRYREPCLVDINVCLVLRSHMTFDIARSSIGRLDVSEVCLPRIRGSECEHVIVFGWLTASRRILDVEGPDLQSTLRPRQCQSVNMLGQLSLP